MLVLTRTDVLDVRSLVPVAEISTSARGLAAEVESDRVDVGLDRQSVINCDGLHTIAQTTLTCRVGEVDAAARERVCSAVSYTNHCPHCLWSRHVDVHPGDRAARCRAPMRPFRLLYEKGRFVLVHECVRCGAQRRCRASRNDDLSTLLG